MPITPENAAIRVLSGRHAFTSFANPGQIEVAAGCAQSFALDNGAYPFWRGGEAPDWSAYYKWAERWLRHPGCDFAVIPDVIDGGEADNDALIAAWPFWQRGVPVWHMHESLERLKRLCREWPRVALGSSGEYAAVGNARWWGRMSEAMNRVCPDGYPITKLHGLRMLNPEVFTRLPLASADSTNVARNIGLDSAWRGTYTPANKETRAQVIAERIEQFNGADRWEPVALATARLFA